MRVIRTRLKTPATIVRRDLVSTLSKSSAIELPTISKDVLMYANEITSLQELSKTEHEAVANLAMALLSLIVKLEDGTRSPPSPVVAMREKTATPPGAKLILDRLEKARVRI